MPKTNDFEARLAKAESLAAFETRLQAAELDAGAEEKEERPCVNALAGTIGDNLLGMFQRPPTGPELAQTAGFDVPQDELPVRDPVDTGDVQAFVRSIPGLFGKQLIGERFDDERAAIAAQDTGLAEKHPIWTQLGEVAGDIASLGLIRAPLTPTLVKIEKFIKQGGFGKFFLNPKNLTQLWSRRVIESTKLRAMFKGAFRVGEAGGEAAMLDIMKGDSPGETAGYAMAFQAGTGLGAEAWKGLTSGDLKAKGTKFAVTAAVTAMAFQAWKNLVPGGDDGSGLSATIEQSESMDFAIDKTLLWYGLGAASVAVGGGRARGASDDLSAVAVSPRFMDFMNSIPRVAIISMFEDMANSDPETQAVKLQQLEQAATDPALAAQLFGGELGPTPPNLNRPHP